MIRSMTGYGRAQAVVDGLDITVEIKSVNHRYFEFSARTPRGYSFVEEKLKSYAQSRVSRGKIDMYVTIVAVDNPACEVVLNEALAQSYVDAIRKISEVTGVRDDLSNAVVARYQDIFTVRRAVADEEQVCENIMTVVREAMDRFVEMREAEGAKMRADVESRVETIKGYVAKIEERSPQTVAEYMQKLRAKISDLLGGATVDEQRLITEVAIYADKVAVAEETVRLRSHFDQLAQMMESGEAIGRKLDFLVQEMNRETNTIGSKAQDVTLAHIVVDVKAELEKIREQIQNIE